MSSHSLTLGHFKEQLRKKGNYRWVVEATGSGVLLVFGARGRRPSGSCCRFKSAGLGGNHKPTWEHLTRLGRSEQAAAAAAAFPGESASLNLACAPSVRRPLLLPVWRGCGEKGWEEEFELQRFGSHLVLISMLRHT